jgi:cysteine desulfurase / selenocysteine lyase
MSIPIPTRSEPEGSNDHISDNLLDENVLGKLANEFFRQLPEGSGVDLPHRIAEAFFPSNLQPSQARLDSTSLSSPLPQLVPASNSLNAGAPSQLQSVVPAGSGAGEGLLGIPAIFNAALPKIDPVPPASSTSPYYFINETGVSLPSNGGVQSLAEQPDRITAQPFNLPGLDQLNSLLEGISLGYEHGQPVEPPARPAADRYLYFVDPLGTAPQQTPSGAHSGQPPFDLNLIRRDFPILSERVHGRPLVWFDNAATTQKPKAVIDRLTYFYSHENSNVHRGAHDLAARSTDAYEGARSKVAHFLGAASPEEIVFVRGSTEGINLVAQTYGRQNIGAGDEIVISLLEHHANIVPWQQIAAEKGAKLRVIPVDDSGQIILEEYAKLLNERTKVVAITHVSNALGTITPLKEIITLAHRVGAVAVVDGAQSVSHLRVNVQALDADFLVFSGHKIFGPTGIGVVYGKKALLEKLPPWQGGGNMIADVTFERTLYKNPPARFEAGTGNIADAVGLGAALDYLEHLGRENVAIYEHNLLLYAMNAMRSVPGLRLIGTAKEKTSVLSFVLAGYQVDEVGKALNEEGIAVRTGHHCAQPILRRFGLEATIRPSIAFYNTCAEVDQMVTVLKRLASRTR